MSEFKTSSPGTAPLDPYKRVHYSNGLVLGVDEFLQEEHYLLEKHRLHNRGLHGYGTVCGLSVAIEGDAVAGPKIKVRPGIAINPKGQEIRVSQEQCALLDDWLNREKNKAEIQSRISSPPELSIYLVLCYRECPTDLVPIPSGPCVSLEDSSAPSRIADHFELKLTVDPPDQTEDKKVEEFIDLLRQIEISDEPGDFLTKKELEDWVRDLGELTSPPLASPPIPMRMHPDDAEEFINAAFRVWVTVVRPQLLEAGRNCVSGPPREDCVLLARLEFEVDDTGVGLRVLGDVKRDEEDRPYLLHTRLLQEYLISCCTRVGGEDVLTSPPLSLPPTPIDESNLMHLTGDETVPGEKTFSGRILLEGAGRVRKRIALSSGQALPSNAAVRPRVFRSAAALRFAVTGATAFNGDAIFGFSLPDDIDLNLPIQVRLLWGFSIGGGDAGNVNFTWQIRNKSLGLNEEIPGTPAGFSSVDVTGSVPRILRDRLLTTGLIDLPDPMVDTDQYGTLRVRITAFAPAPVTAQVFLMQAEIVYTANRLGGGLP